MSFTIVPTLNYSNQARADLSRITQELASLQRQTASGNKSDDLAGFGEGASRLLQARSLVAQAEGRIALGREVQARLDLQASALGKASQTVSDLAQAVRGAAVNGFGASLGEEVKIAFGLLSDAMNETTNGQPIFAGERAGGPVVRTTTLEALMAVSSREAVFNEAGAAQRIDLGEGLAFDIAERAGDISWQAFQGMRDLALMIDASGGALPLPVGQSDRDVLLSIAARLEAGRDQLLQAEARAGSIQNRIESTINGLEGRTNVIRAEVARQTDADLGEVALRLAALQTQYQASAQTFAQLSRLSLLDFL